ncbi:MAG: hypothetical protein ABIB97_04320 [Patescibacteria group bacterium]
MTKKVITLTCLLALVTLAGWSCKSAAEKTAEKTIESSTNGAVEADIDDDTVTFTDKNSNSTTTIGQADLPDDWPTDAPTCQGDIIAATTVGGTYFSTTWQTDESVDDLYDSYEGEVTDQGWTTEATATIAGIKSLTATKGNRTLNVHVSRNESENMTNCTVAVTSE